MKVTRRDFLKYSVGSAAALGFDATFLGRLEKALAAGGTPIIWLAAANCTGCTVSLANRVATSKPTDVADLLVNTINLVYHPNLMAAAGDLAVETLRNNDTNKGFVLVVEGGIPTAFNGKACMLWTENGADVTAMEAVQDLAPRAKAVVCVGTCGSFGGIPKGNPNPTAIKTVKDLTGVSTINIPGCPTHPDWVVWTVAQLLAGTTPPVDSQGRPTQFFSSTVHSKCPRRENKWAPTLGATGCLQGIGCKGTATKSDCPTRKWNNGTNWCVGANSICLGCTESGFPDTYSPFYSATGALPSGHRSVDTTRTCIDCHGPNGADDD